MPVFCACHGESFTADEFVAIGLLGFPGQIVGGRHDRLCSGGPMAGILWGNAWLLQQHCGL